MGQLEERSEEQALVLFVQDDLAVASGSPDLLKELLSFGEVQPKNEFETRRLPDVAATLGAIAGMQGTTGEFVRLSGHSVNLLKQFGPVPAEPGFFRAFVHGPNGRIAGQLTWQPVQVAAQHALSLQLAAATVALRLAIGNLEHAVERVEEKISAIQVFLQTEQIGDVLGRYEVLRQVAENIAQGAVLAQADWDAVAGIGPECARDIQRIRSWVTRSAQFAGRDRSDALKTLTELREPLALLTIAEQSQLLWHAIKLEQIKLHEPQRLDDSIEAGRTTLRAQRELDTGLRDLMWQFIVDASVSKETDALVPRRRQSAEAVRATGTQLLTWFEDERMLANKTLKADEVPTFRDGLQEVGKVAVSAGRYGTAAIGRGLSAAGEKMQGRDNASLGESDADTERSGVSSGARNQPTGALSPASEPGSSDHEPLVGGTQPHAGGEELDDSDAERARLLMQKDS
jgi:hypothetical protein